MPGKLILETQRLLLHEFCDDDAPFFLRLNSHPQVMQYVGNKALLDLSEALQVMRDNPMADYRKHGFGRWLCSLKGTGEPIGFSGLKYLNDLREVDLGYRFLPEFWGHGLATESSKAVLERAWNQLELKRVIGLVDPANIASAHVLEKCGMRYEGMVPYWGNQVAQYAIESK